MDSSIPYCLEMTTKNSCPDNGYYNNTNGRCECNDGYVRSDCSEMCSPGEYGYACSKRCISCPKEECNHIYGCSVVSTLLLGIPSTSADKETLPNPGDVTVVISVVSVTSTVVVVGILLLCCYCLRTRKKRRRNGTNEDASGSFLMQGMGGYPDPNNSDNLYNEPNFYESDVTSGREVVFQIDSKNIKTKGDGTAEVDKDDYNHLILKTDLNPEYVRDNTDTYSHIKTKLPPSRALTDNEYSHIGGVVSP